MARSDLCKEFRSYFQNRVKHVCLDYAMQQVNLYATT